MLLSTRPDSDTQKRRTLLEDWYRAQIKAVAPRLIEKWERRLDVKVKCFFVQKMKTKWGSCNPKARSIRLNTELAKKPSECLEYIVVHEMAHLIARRHDARFTAMMDRYLPNWKHVRQTLNEASLDELSSARELPPSCYR